jgi:hypothetical protein
MGFLSALLRRETRNPNPGAAATPHGRTIIAAYDAAIAARRSIVSDAALLPYPKPAIQAALLEALFEAQGAERERLKVSYVSLADWQDGVGAGPYSFETTMKMAKRVAGAGPSHSEITAKAASEGQALLDQLKALGL